MRTQALVSRQSGSKQAIRTQLRAVRALAVVALPAAIQAALDSMVALKLTACHTLPELALHELQLSQVGTDIVRV